MQSMLNLHGSYGLPLCVTGINNHLTISKEMADHDRRREDIKKKQRSEGKEVVVQHNNLEMGIQANVERDQLQVQIQEIVVVVDEDLACLLQDLSNICLANCTARAA